MRLANKEARAHKKQETRILMNNKAAGLCALDDGAEGVQRPVQTRNYVCIRNKKL